jgi:hypothetical protein
MPFTVVGYEEEPEVEEKPKGKFKVVGYEEPSFAQKHGFKGIGFEKPLSVVKAGAKGVLEGVQNINPLQPGSMIPQSVRQQVMEQVLPDLGEEEEKIARRGGKLLPMVALGPEAAEAKLIQLALGTTAGELAEQAGAGELGQGLAEVGGTSLPNVLKTTTQTLKNIAGKKITETLPSGLTKPRAVESNLNKVATIGKKTQAEAIEKLNKEASQLTRQSVEKNIPLFRQVEAGFDQSKIDKAFSNLEKTAERSRVTLDLEPTFQLMDQYADKYKGVPNPHGDALKIQKEVQAFRKKPPNTLNRALKTFRSNNKKLREINEKSLVEGTQAEYTKFLRDENKAITESFRQTLGADNEWVKQFESMNSITSKIKTAEKVMADLEPLLQGRNLTPKSLEKLAFDKKSQKKLAVRMKDENAAKEIIQIAKDLHEARTAIKKIPKTALHKWELAAPMTYFIPGLHALPGVYAGQKIGRHMLGYWLSKPETRRAYGKALDAIKNQNFSEYQKQTMILMKAIKERKEEE